MNADMTPKNLVCIHAPSPGPYEPVVNGILDEIAKIKDGMSMILAGDFNITTALRHSSEAIKNTAGERRILSRMRKEFGLFNAWQTLHPNQDLPQTLRWTKKPSAPYHCDAIFVSHDLLPHLVSAEVISTGDWGVISDHNPILITLD